MVTYKRSWKNNQKEQTKAKTFGVRLAWSLQWIVAWTQKASEKSLPCLHPVQHRLSRSSVVFVCLIVLLFLWFFKTVYSRPMTVVTYTSWWARYPVADTIHVQEERKCTVYRGRWMLPSTVYLLHLPPFIATSSIFFNNSMGFQIYIFFSNLFRLFYILVLSQSKISPYTTMPCLFFKHYFHFLLFILTVGHWILI